jgi:hypothetical protein
LKHTLDFQCFITHDLFEGEIRQTLRQKFVGRKTRFEGEIPGPALMAGGATPGFPVLAPDPKRNLVLAGVSA